MILVGYIFGFYTPEDALEAVDWNVIFLLAAMMTIVSIMIPTGGFQWMAYKIAAMSKGRLYLMLCLLGTCVTVLSLLLDNVTTVVIFGPLIILIARAMKVSPIPYLLAAALLSDTGGIATLVGDPPNLMIGSAADISFNRFVLTMGPIVLVAWLVCLFMLKFLFKKELAETPADTTSTVRSKRSVSDEAPSTPMRTSFSTQSRPAATWTPTPARSLPIASRRACTEGSVRTSMAGPSARSSNHPRA